MSVIVFLLFPPRDRRPPPTLCGRLNAHPFLHRRRFSVPRSANGPDVALCAIDPLFLFRTVFCPLLIALSRFPNTIRFGNRPPLVQMSVPAHESLLVRKVVSMLSCPVISWARLQEIVRWSDLFMLCSDDAKQHPVGHGAEFGVVLWARDPRTASIQ